MLHDLPSHVLKFVRAAEAQQNGERAYSSSSGGERPSRMTIAELISSGALRRDGSGYAIDEDVAEAMGLHEYNYS